MIPVSVIVLTRNEARNLPACLASLAEFDEVFVVDSGSDDGTAEIARSLGARVVDFRWNGRYPRKKQWSLDNLPLERDWALFLDADERVTPEGAREIDEIARGADRGGAVAFRSSGIPVFLGRALRHGRGYSKIILLDRRRCRFPEIPDLDVETMWEVEGHYQPTVDGAIGRLRAPHLHGDDKPLFAWFDRHNRYSDWEARLGADGRLDAIIRAERGPRRIARRLYASAPARPLLVFLWDYVVRLGLLDGRAGLHFALARAFHLWQIDVKRLDISRRSARRPES